MVCSGGFDDATNCRGDDVCVPMSFVNDQNNTCWNSCPLDTCGPNDIICPGGIDHYSGCPIMEVCMGNDPNSTCTVSCPVQCNYDTEYHCGSNDANGCWQDSCCDKTFGVDGMECPHEHSMMCDGPNNQLCTGEIDSNGCKQPDSCHSTYLNSTCPASCPITCDDATQYHCGSDVDGCWQDSCCDKTFGTDGMECMNHYSMTCNGPDNLFCPGGIESNGCQMMDMCMWNNPNSTCTVSCPVTCSNGQLHCPGEAGADGCPLADTCIDNPAFNDPDACNAFCPKSCGDDSYLCSSMAGNGCPEMGWCKHKHDNCQDLCPMLCSGNEMHCPESDADGCELAGTCVASGESCPSSAGEMSGSMAGSMPGSMAGSMPGSMAGSMTGTMAGSMPGTMAGCPAIDSSCPNNGEIYCYGQWDQQTQCEEQGYCAAPVGNCTATCSATTCGANDLICSMGTDPSTGCHYGDYCMTNDPDMTCSSTCPIQCNYDTQYHCGSNDANGCYQDSCCDKTFGVDGNECAHVYPMTCVSGDMMCSGGVASNGCQLADHCMTANPDSNCATTCPITCDSDNEYHCGSTDANGCSQDACCAKTFGDDGMECANVYPMTCGSEQIMCSDGVDSNGCELGDYCMGTDPESSCPVSCPITCNYDTQYHCGSNDANGCYQDSCCDKTFGSDGTECPPQGSMPCDGPTSHFCEGQIDNNGCKQPDMCMSNDPNSSCAPTCPATCNYDIEHHCASTDSNGCWTDACCANDRDMDETESEL